MRRIAKRFSFIVLLSAPWLTAPSNVAAEVVPLDLVKIDNSEPGVLVFDGSDRRLILPLYDGVRDFPSMEAYQAFLTAVLNVVDWEEGASVITVGQLYAYDVNLEQFIPVSNALATLVGGRFGRVRVEGIEYCVDPDRCGGEHVDLYTLEAVEPMTGELLVDPEGVDVSEANITSFSGFQSELNGNPVQPGPPFLVEGIIEHSEKVLVDVVLMRIIYVATRAETRQVMGGYRSFPILFSPAAQVCAIFSGALGGCYLVPQSTVVGWTEGENRLLVQLRDYKKVVNGIFSCYSIVYPNRQTEEKSNVSKVEVAYVRRYVDNGRFFSWQEEANFRPQIIIGRYAGWDVAEPYSMPPRQEGEMKLMFPWRYPPECRDYVE